MKISRPLLTAALALGMTCLLAGSALPASAAIPAAAETYLVVSPGSTHTRAADVAAVGGSVVQELSHIHTVVARLTPRAAAALAARPNFIVEQEKTFTVSDTQTNPPSRGLDRIDQTDLPLDTSYSYPAAEQGAGVTAYVIDTGVRADHSEFVTGGTSRVTLGYRYPSYTDTSGSGDCDGHGTHVAGTIGGNTVGVAKQVSIAAVAVMDCSGGGTSTSIAAGVNWVVGNHAAGTPAVANMSLGGGASTAIDNVVNQMYNDGIVVVVAAGNSGADACNYSPARNALAITVAATDSTDTRTSWSNYGSCTDLFAPGSSIYSSYYTSSTAYATLSGTSMAAPHTAGVVARYLTTHQAVTPATAWTDIQATLTSGLVKSPETGSPNLLLYASPTGAEVPVDATAPGTPTGLSETAATSTTLTSSWTAPSDNGGTAITGYTVQLSPASDFSSGVTEITTGSTTATFTGLTNSNAPYYLRVAATNSVGTGAWSANVAGALAPAQVAQPSLTAITTSAITANWTTPTTGGSAITGYTVTWKAGSAAATSISVGAGAQSYQITGLTGGTTYTVTVTARNASGAGTASTAATATTATVPAPTAPRSFTGVTTSKNSVSLNWVAPSSGAGSFTGYVLKYSKSSTFTSSTGSVNISSASTAYALNGLAANTKYYFRMQAVNGTVVSPWSSTLTLTTPRR